MKCNHIRTSSALLPLVAGLRPPFVNLAAEDDDDDHADEPVYEGVGHHFCPCTLAKLACKAAMLCLRWGSSGFQAIARWASSSKLAGVAGWPNSIFRRISADITEKAAAMAAPSQTARQECCHKAGSGDMKGERDGSLGAKAQERGPFGGQGPPWAAQQEPEGKRQRQ